MRNISEFIPLYEQFRLKIRVKDHLPFDINLRRFKKKVEKSGKLEQLEAKQFFEKPSVKRKREKAAAIKRWQRKVEETSLIKTTKTKKKKELKKRSDVFTAFDEIRHSKHNETTNR